jgi:hypothetical protein
MDSQLIQTAGARGAERGAVMAKGQKRTSREPKKPKQEKPKPPAGAKSGGFSGIKK